MSSISYNNPFQLQKQYSKPLVKPSVRQEAPMPQPALKSNSRAFGALKMAQFMAPESSQPAPQTFSQDSFHSSSSFADGYASQYDSAPTVRQNKVSPSPKIAQPQQTLLDTQSGLLQSLSSPARKRDAAPLASEDWLQDAPVYDDMSIYRSAATNPWQQVKEKLMDIFFEPLPEQVASTVVAPVNVQPMQRPQQDRPIGIAQLTRVTFSSSTQNVPTRSPIERLKKQ